jgi:predicted TPR repeat methyltransferase
MVFSLGLDSRKYKKYYKKLQFKSTEGVALSDVDDYKDEGDAQIIIRLVDNIARVIAEPRSILDIGCGTGRYLQQMNTRWPGSHFEGIDISKEIVEKFTRKLLPSITIHILDIETDERFHIEKKEKFDLICMIGIVQILSLKRIHHILEKVNMMCRVSGHVYVQFNVETEEKKSSVGYKRYSLPELEALLIEHGFEIMKSERTDLLRDYAYIIAKRSAYHEELP